ALVERNVKNVAANVAAHDFHHLGASHIREPIHLNVVTRLQTETPRVLSIVIERSCAHGCERGNYDCGDCPKQSSSSLLRKWTAARRDTLLRPQKWRFLLRVQVDQASIIKLFARRFVGRGVQLFLYGRTSFTCQQASCRGNR